MNALVKHKNSGFSLIELIVVVLIIGILATGTVVSFSAVYYSDAERAAKTICSYMTMARAKAIAYDGSGHYIKVKITQDSDERYYIGIYDGADDSLIEPAGDKPKLLSKYSVALYAGPKPSDVNAPIDLSLATYKKITPTDTIEYTFNKSSGSIKKAAFSDMDDSNNSYVDLVIEGPENYRVIFVTATGRCYLNE